MKNNRKKTKTTLAKNQVISINENLKYAGVWKDIDTELFKDFTDNLIERRERNFLKHQ